MSATLAIAGLVAGYGGSRVLSGVDLTLAPGSVTALLGRNGTGKTTLCRACAGLIHPTAGSIRIDGVEVCHSAPHRIAHLGVSLVPQGREVFEAFSVAENLRLGAIGAGRRVEERKAYAWFPALEPLSERVAGTLSGGEQQMLALARALVGAPRILILDEPSEGLAPIVAQALGASLRAIVADAGLTVLLVEQDLELVRQVASTCAFLVNGGIAATMPAAALSPQSEAVHRYLVL